MDTYSYTEGSSPLLLSLPHDGTAIPDAIAARMTETGRGVPDTDWQVSRLYGFAAAVGASILRPVYSRYVVDLNRPPDGAALYPGAPNTGLCPTASFAGESLYQTGAEPDPDEIEARRARYWQPYHKQLRETLAALRARHGFALLWDAHSIRSRVSRLFPGRLPDLNLGTYHGASCAAALEQALAEVLAAVPEYTHVINGRFSGGYITRHYGDPDAGIHAVQLEQAQITYMDETPPFAWSEACARRVQDVLRGLLRTMLRWSANEGTGR